MNTAATQTLALATMIPCAILLYAPPARAAEAADHPEWKVGDKWTFRYVENPGAKASTWTREVMAVLPDGKRDVATGTGGGRLTFDSDTNSLDKRGPEYTWRRLKFPMTVGASWSHEYKTAGSDWQGSAQSNWRVLAYEKITVPAGTFDCFKVEGETFQNWQMADRQYQSYIHGFDSTTYWYCPAIKWAAKWEIAYTPGSGIGGRVSTVWELVSFEQKP
jgi:hypothetical protein